MHLSSTLINAHLYTVVHVLDCVNTGFSSMDESTALFLLRSITDHFVAIATQQAQTLPDLEGRHNYYVYYNI